MAWYVESWQPEEGLAFIGLRQNDGQSVQMFHVGAPHFEAVPVRGLPTALWATRGAFQESVFDSTVPPPGVRELAFAGLTDAIQFVRRVFIACGPHSRPAHHFSLWRLPPVPIPARLCQVVRALVDLNGRASRDQAREELDRLSENTEYLDSLRQLAIGTLAAMPAPGGSGLASDEDRVAVLLLLEKTGLWDGLGHILRAWMQLRDTFVSASLPDPPTLPPGRVTGSGAAAQPRIMHGLLFRLPSVLESDAPYEGIASLGDHLCAAAADGAYLRLLSGSALLSLNLAALLAVAATVDLLPGSVQHASAVLRRANQWLAAELPQRMLENVPGAEEVITAAFLRAISPTSA